MLSRLYLFSLCDPFSDLMNQQNYEPADFEHDQNVLIQKFQNTRNTILESKKIVSKEIDFSEVKEAS